MDEIYARPGHLIRRAQQIAVAVFMEETAGFDVTPVQFAALVAIRENPDVDATRLSALIAFDRSTLGRVLDILERKGLIVRRGAGNDRRVKLLRVTEEAAARLKAMAPGVERAQQRILGPLPPAERARFMRSLERIVQMNNTLSRAPMLAGAED
ncbi:MarR family winged helix-turn-helix transcriptional regulator [Falsiroseomonas sp. HW251]|uniref:MarR family winged helix-turn-helix transcriptional regulator n=1 Tax=Falsiroseomonas sp. HW251 TaxID=3390998 RepID=UPI003D3112E6